MGLNSPLAKKGGQNAIHNWFISNINDGINDNNNAMGGVWNRYKRLLFCDRPI